MTTTPKSDYGEFICLLREVLGLDPRRDIWRISATIADAHERDHGLLRVATIHTHNRNCPIQWL